MLMCYTGSIESVTSKIYCGTLWNYIYSEVESEF